MEDSCVLFGPARKISHLLSHQFKQKSGGRRECCQRQQPPRRDRTPELFQREIRPGAQRHQIITMWPRASFAGARAVYLFCRAAKSNKTPSGLPSVKVLERAPPPPSSSQCAGKAKNPDAYATSWNSINGTRRVVCARVNIKISVDYRSSRRRQTTEEAAA
jgi:hypothetical protein